MVPARFPTRASAVSSAFTLIELLIVVAIIAILAAIAVPNFLEAQTRSKVSKAKADMRTLATALESYRVDTNHLPLSTADNENGPIGSNPIYNGPFPTAPRYAYSWLVTLTSPISYITSMSPDPFGGQLSPFFPLIDYRRMVKGSNPAHTYTILQMVNWGEGNSLRNNLTANADGWALWSVGPDKKQNLNTGVPVGFGAQVGTMSFYDPTNGTVSVGDIIRSSWGDEKSLGTL